ncbi:unnamed protein product [Auanema sp. JU1783]|nr:unnamed protein product [Auanema sp. JU1783]
MVSKIYEEADSFVLSVRWISNILIVIALPFQCMLIRVLWKNRKISEYTSPFYLTVQINCFLNVLQTLAKLFVDVPATSDAFRESYAENANIVGKLINFRGFYISMIIVSNLAYITINRLAVILHVDTYRKKPVLRSTIKKLFSIWLFWSILCLPIVWPIEYRAVRLDAIDYDYQIISSQRFFQKVYVMSSIVHTFSVLILTYVAYIIIGIQLYKKKNAVLKKRVLNVTLAALLMSLGMILCIGIVAADFIASRFGYYFLTQNYYQMVFNLGIDFNVFITPISVIALTTDVRKRLFAS